MREKQLIERFNLVPHPEGGFFVEDFRSGIEVECRGQRRRAGTHIHYLLPKRGISRWHRIASDELWHLYEGGPLILHLVSEDFSQYWHHTLATDGSYMAVVPAGTWQAAHSPEEYSLTGCTVVPGFEYAEFVMLRDCEEEKKRLLERHPEAGFLI